MKTLPSLSCPYCQGPTEVREVHCPSCEAGVRGSFPANEFSALSADDLHFLRIFLKFEGRIRDMEAPLGLSYPTIRSRLTRLKEKVLGSQEASLPPSPASPIEALERGELSFEQALSQIKNRKKERK